ncbi:MULTISPECIES: CBS domain-containing protein [unclassified Rhizobium]|uniref:CBS domain-containing protein n=1 Tax=unclassified Rhizobium TaxID=2613769 RepID=UPI000420F27C|nr:MULTISPECIES: CBS domain-containing protein [unclassified Rhizobium]MBD9450104.1 CBS domain-containing protein [Rhizobium sp. RHZ02]NMN68874.1 putative signal-transduction protein containing cAMP-binding and CBS domains [Rhizobium sp. 57MFTsu3.2]
MHVRQILNSKSPEIVSVTPNHTMVEVLRLFRENNIGFVIVARYPGECLGTVSERDCCNAVAKYGTQAPAMRVSEIMSQRVATCSTDDLLPLVMAIMTERRTRHVLVMEGDNIAGIVSIGDVVKYRLEEAMRTEQDLQDYICGVSYH